MPVDCCSFHCVCRRGLHVGVLFCGVDLGVLSSLAIIYLRKGYLVIFLYLCCGCLCSLSLPYGAMDWTSDCYCGNSLSYSLKFWRHLSGSEFGIPAYILLFIYTI